MGFPSGGSGGSSSPGFEIGYSQITAPVNIIGTTEGAATTVISPGAITFDGTAVIVEIFAPYIKTGSGLGATANVAMFESTTDVSGIVGGGLTFTASEQIGGPFVGRFRFTPSAGSHTYTVQAWVSSTTGTPAFGAGAGGTGNYAPAFIRFTKA